LIRFAYDLVSRVPLEKIVILPNLTAESTASGLAFPLLRDDFGQFNDAAARKLATSETFFDHRPYVTMANFARGGQPAYQIRKPSDLVELCVNEFLTTADPVRRHRLDSVLVDLDLPVSLQGDLTAAGGTLFAALIAPLTTDKDAIFAVLKGAIVDEGRAAKSSSSPCVAAPTAGDLLADVTTFAGIGKPGDANRVAAACTFNGPTNLCLDPFNALLVSEDGGNRIRRIDLVDPNHAVTTLAGDGQRAFAEGPARVAQFNAPAGMVVDAHNSAHPVLYVADSGNNRIRMIADYTSTAAATVSTLAGDGTQDYADGSGATARFNNPQGLALGKDGALYVSDTDNNRLRRIDLVDPAHTVTTLAGSGTGKSIVGIGVLAAFHEPRGIAFTPFGDLLVVDTHRHKIRWVNSTGSVGDYAGDGPDGGADNDYYSALFNYPRGIAVDASGNAVLADTDNQAIRWLDKRGFVVTIAGGGTKGKDAGGYLDGHGAVAQFNSPRGVAIAEDGTIYVADTRNHRIRMLKLPAH
jgi:serine/threonine-protein kinase